jgi:hypothetical protein
VLGGLVVIMVLGTIAPAFARRDDRRDDHRHYYRGGGYAPGYVYAPPPVVYAPAPSPGIDLIFPIHIR